MLLKVSNEIYLAPSAIVNLEAISDYFLAQNVEAGKQLFQKFNTRFQSLTRFLNLGKPYPNLCPKIRGLIEHRAKLHHFLPSFISSY